MVLIRGWCYWFKAPETNHGHTINTQKPPPTTNYSPLFNSNVVEITLHFLALVNTFSGSCVLSRAQT